MESIIVNKLYYKLRCSESSGARVCSVTRACNQRWSFSICYLAAGPAVKQKAPMGDTHLVVRRHKAESPLDNGKISEEDTISYTDSEVEGIFIVEEKSQGDVIHKVVIRHSFVCKGNSLSILVKVSKPRGAAGGGGLNVEMEHNYNRKNSGSFFGGKQIMPFQVNPFRSAKSNDGGCFGETEEVSYGVPGMEGLLVMDKSGLHGSNSVGHNFRIFRSAVIRHNYGTKDDGVSIIVEIRSKDEGLSVVVKPTVFIGGRSILVEPASYKSDEVDKYDSDHGNLVPFPFGKGKLPQLQYVCEAAKPRSNFYYDSPIGSRYPPWRYNFSNRGQQNLRGLVNSSGYTSGLGNNSVYFNFFQ
ncbi:hypothetical protein O6P43_021833 [Quillaja saponaria]|uniref:Uncharacterized protein n=1 Tax=Quillaja saponaria TaxID=32244 RepID=A0AAD7LBT5_QUISA|nr:hypothetical protein O6P43_021833 [Quillaja saponaria]